MLHFFECTLRWFFSKGMMRVLLTTFGSYGDLHPFLAMCLAIKENGGEATLVTHPRYRGRVERLGIPFLPLKPGEEEIGAESEWSGFANDPKTGTAWVYRNLIQPYLQENYRTIYQAAAGVDLVISHFLTFSTPVAAEDRGVPWLSCALQPSSVPLVRGSGYARKLFQALAHSPEAPAGDSFFLQGASPFGTLALFPSAFAGPAPNWPGNVRQIGFPLFDQETTADLSRGAEAFLRAGPAPVAFTLGSAIVLTKNNFYTAAYAAVKALGRRAVFLVGPKPQGLPPADPGIYVSGYEPHSRLFPHCAAVVHPCGMGTMAQAMAAGRPQVLVPHVHDQPDNARRAAALGLGPLIEADELNARRLTAAVEAALAEPYPSRAAKFAEGLGAAEFTAELNAALGVLYSEL